MHQIYISKIDCTWVPLRSLCTYTGKTYGHTSYQPDGLRHYDSLIYPSHKSHHAFDINPTMHHFVTEMCTFVHISVTKRCIVGCMTSIYCITCSNIALYSFALSLLKIKDSWFLIVRFAQQVYCPSWKHVGTRLSVTPVWLDCVGKVCICSYHVSNLFSRTFPRSATRMFLYYWRVRLLTAIAIYGGRFCWERVTMTIWHDHGESDGHELMCNCKIIYKLVCEVFMLPSIITFTRL